MKKRVLFSAIALFVAGLFSAQAQLVFKSAPYQPQAFGKTNSAVLAPTRAAGAMAAISYCGDYGGSIGLSTNQECGAALLISRATVNSFVGKQLSAVQLGIGTFSTGSIHLFLSYDLNGDPFYKQDVTLLAAQGWNTFELTTPYTLEADKPFYIGYTITPSSSDFPFGVDYAASSVYSDYSIYVQGSWVAAATAGATRFGNICIRGLVSGDLDNYSQNEVTLDAIGVPSVVETNKDFTIEGQFTNNGVQIVNSIDVTYTIGTMAAVTKTITLEEPIYNLMSYIFSISDARINYVGANVPVTVSISKVNGVEDEKPADNEKKTTLLSSNTVFDRNVVVEEGTGTWCGYCPRGIVGMEYMRETYPGTFIGIGVHYGDAMATSSYSYYSASGYPYSKTNRKSIWEGVDPSQANLEYIYTYERSFPTEAKIDLVARYADDAKSSVDLFSTATFGLNMQSANYRVAYVVLENEVGPYNQQNYFSKEGENQGDMAGWEDKAPQVSTIFNDVARNIFSYNGLTGSVPTTIEANKGYDYSYTASLSNVKNTDNIELVAMLLNATSGEIVNAVKIPASAIGAFGGVADNVAAGSVSITAGKGEITIVGDCDNAAVYGIDGRLVKATAESTIEVPAGLYIVKASANGKPTVSKVLVK